MRMGIANSIVVNGATEVLCVLVALCGKFCTIQYNTII